MPSEGWSNVRDHFLEPGFMARGMLETAFTLPGRALSRSRLENMSLEEKDFAHLSKEVYSEPADRSPTLRQYTLLQGEIPAAGGHARSAAMLLNDKRWAVFRASNQVDHVLAFRGTAGMTDVFHNIDLISGLGEHTYTIAAATWALEVMLLLSNQRNSHGARFAVTGHSLGGTVAMGVMIMLNDIPATVQYVNQNAPRVPQYVMNAWNVATAKIGTTPPSYNLVCGHIFNPGAFPASTGRDAASGRTGETRTGETRALVAGKLGSLALRTILDSTTSRRNEAGTDRGTNGVDKRVTTHHILGDLLSCSFHLGTEKTYAPKDKRARRLTALLPGAESFKQWGPHSMSNFL